MHVLLDLNEIMEFLSDMQGWLVRWTYINNGSRGGPEIEASCSQKALQEKRQEGMGVGI